MEAPIGVFGARQRRLRVGKCVAQSLTQCIGLRTRIAHGTRINHGTRIASRDADHADLQGQPRDEGDPDLSDRSRNASWEIRGIRVP